jgi:protein phosphatase
MAGLKNFLQNLFGNSPVTPVSSDEEAEPSFDELFEATPPPPTAVEPVAPVAPATVPVPARSFAGLFAVGWMTDTGRVRDHNEDALCIFSGQQESDNAMPPFGLFMLADGMGGHHDGEVASALALRVTAERLLSQIYMPILSGIERGADQPSLTDVIRDAIAQANRLVTQELPGSGCTLTCGMVLGDRLFVGHVGDSRAYLLRKDQAPKQLTKDHSLVNRLMEMGQLTEQEAAVHPQRNVLYRAIGQGGSLEVDVLTYALKHEDRLLLCSDGLWGMLEEAEMWRLLEDTTSPQAACVELVQAANEAGGNDNISVVLTDIWLPEA